MQNQRSPYKSQLPIVFDESRKTRPQFERMIEDLVVAKRQWDYPKLREYSLVLLYLTGTIAIAESLGSEVQLKWPVEEKKIKERVRDREFA